MISVSAETTKALERQGARIRFLASVGAPVSKTLDPVLSSVPVLRHGVLPGERTVDVSNASIVCDNGDGRFNDFVSGSWLYGKDWNGSLVTVSLAVQAADGSWSSFGIYGGLLDDVQFDVGQRSAELLLVDPFTRLRRNNVNASFVGRTYSSECPAKIVWDMLVSAGFSAIVETSSFTNAVVIERQEQKRIRSYEVPTGSKWWDEIATLLAQSNGGLRLNSSGKIEYYTYSPLPPGEVWTFHARRNASGIRHSKPYGDIENYYEVQIDDGTGTGTFVDSANSPIQDAASVASWGEISQVLQFGFTIDEPAENVASERLDAKAQPPRIFEVDAPIAAAVVELWDVVRVVDDVEGIDSVGVVFERAISGGDLRTTFRVYAETGITSNDWLFTENGQFYDDAQKVY